MNTAGAFCGIINKRLRFFAVQNPYLSERRPPMPATYAHFRFGREVLRRLSPETREAITPRIQLYHIGLHGPDIFFYYHPLSKKPGAGPGRPAAPPLRPGDFHPDGGGAGPLPGGQPAGGWTLISSASSATTPSTPPPMVPSTKASKRPASPTRRSSRTSTGRCS